MKGMGLPILLLLVMTIAGCSSGSGSSSGGSSGSSSSGSSGSSSSSGGTSGGTGTASAPVFPLKAGANGRYLVDQNGAPFLMVGDSPQSLLVNLSETDATAFFADRQAAGFNALWLQLLCTTATGGRADGSTYDGIVPFTSPGDLTTPNEAYFSRVDDMIRLAAAYGITVFLDPADTAGWLPTLRSNGVAVDRAFGQYLGSRYKNFDNIVWLNGNDFQTWSTAGDDAVVMAVAQGIRDRDTRHLQTIELNYNVSSSLDDANWAPLVQLDAAYTYFPTYAELLHEYNRAGFLPVFMVEANYEFENNTGRDYGTPAVLRRQEYWTMLSGAAGQFYGNHYTWQFIPGWQQNLDSPGSVQMGFLKALFAPLRWYDLVPDQNHALVTAGFGSFSATDTIAGNDYLTAASTADGTLALAYLPTVRTITVDMTRFAAAVTARWFDPSGGVFTAIPESPVANTGPHQFTPPGNNGAGDGDWVLVLTAQ